jgi:hypothetical protein
MKKVSLSSPRMLTAAALALAFAVSASSAYAQASTRVQASSISPLLKVLPRFTAANVPAIGPEEEAADPVVANNPPATDLPGKGLAQHPMLLVGEGYNKILLVNHGKVVWSYSTGSGNEYDDVWMLSNGNVLFTRMYYIAEITPSKQIVWRYDAPKGTEIHTCQPIGFDKVMFVLNGLPAPKLMIVNIHTKAVEVSHDLPAVSTTDQGSVHPQFRRVRVTAQGTYLVSLFQMKRVVEYDKDFKEIWSYDIRSPWAAIRLKNGNTLITDESDVLTREVNPNKETVWELSKKDLPPQYWYGNTQSATRLANGNTIICSRGGNHQGPQMVEVTPDKKVVWALQDWTHVGPVTAVQVLDEPGYPERPGDSTH